MQKHEAKEGTVLQPFQCCLTFSQKVKLLAQGLLKAHLDHHLQRHLICTVLKLQDLLGARTWDSTTSCVHHNNQCWDCW
jgi:hypothetical protein